MLAWFGYSLFYYGLNTVTGGNEHFIQLIWPTAYKPQPRDGGGGGGALPPIAPKLAPPCPPGQVWVGDAANGGCVAGATV